MFADVHAALEEEGFRIDERARRRALADLAVGWELGLGDGMTWTRDNLHDRYAHGQRYDGLAVVDPFALV